MEAAPWYSREALNPVYQNREVPLRAALQYLLCQHSGACSMSTVTQDCRMIPHFPWDLRTLVHPELATIQVSPR